MKSSQYYLHPFIVSLALLFIVVSCRTNPKTGMENMDKEMAEIVNSIDSPKIPVRVIDLCKFSGHKADESGSYDFYNDIQKAIDTLSAKGGGTLLFSHSEGSEAWIKQTEVFRVKGPIILKSNIELRFNPSVRLSFEFSPLAYLPDHKPVLRRYEGTTLYSFSPLIYAFNAENIAITFTGGNGAMPVIDGNGERWQKWSYQGDLRVEKKGMIPAYKAIQTEFNEKDLPISKRICADTGYHFLRPTMIEFIHCKKVKIDGVKLVNSPFWVIHPVFTRDMIVRNVMFDSQVVNNDGIDPESSSNILIENIIFDNHDDNIAIKAGRNREGRLGALVLGSEFEKINSPFVKEGRIKASTNRVVVRNCIFKGHYAFCIGSEISSGANHIYVTDCSAPMSVNMGVFLKGSRKRGGIIDHIFIRNLNFTKVEKEAVCIIANYDKDTISLFPTVFKDIYIENIYVKNAGFGIKVFGWYDAPVENLQINNLIIDQVKGTSQDDQFLMNQIKNGFLKNVRINKKSNDGHFNKREKNVYPPYKG